MKRTDGNADKGESGGRGCAFFKKNKKRNLLGGGGGGLSLEALAFCKNKPFATASQIRKQRELYQNAKKVQKYRKTVKHLAEEGHKFEPCIGLTTSDAEVGDEDISRNEQTLVGNMIKPHHSGNRENNMHTQWNGASTETRGRVQVQSKLEKLRQQSEKKEEEEKLRTEKREAIARQQEACDKAQCERKDAQRKMRKKTQRGQPVMKHRIEHLLDTLQRQVAQ
ncbi:unnamed protein product [Sphagnum jensenii]|uniref:Uncharacterized protein n=1 Tax=Sphagnum jensenii TaxID=128206 RepID=A0ABP0WIT4_9BRYO